MKLNNKPNYWRLVSRRWHDLQCALWNNIQGISGGAVFAWIIGIILALCIITWYMGVTAPEVTG